METAATPSGAENYLAGHRVDSNPRVQVALRAAFTTMAKGNEARFEPRGLTDEQFFLSFYFNYHAYVRWRP